MNICVNVIVVLFVVLGGVANGQDIYLPMPMQFQWPLHSIVLDRAEHLYSLAIKKNKVNFCVQFNEDGTRNSQIFYDREGRVTNVFYNSNDTVSFEKNYVRNSNGEITEIKDIDFAEVGMKKSIYSYISTFKYSDSLPAKHLYIASPGYTYSQEAVYTNGLLTDVIFLFNNDSKKRVKDHVNYEKTEKGTIIKAAKDSDRLYESYSGDSVVVGNLTSEIYIINNSRILKKLIHGIDYGKTDNYIYTENGLLDYSEHIYDIPFVKDKTPGKTYYKYYYYDN